MKLMKLLHCRTQNFYLQNTDKKILVLKTCLIIICIHGCKHKKSFFLQQDKQINYEIGFYSKFPFLTRSLKYYTNKCLCLFFEAQKL